MRLREYLISAAASSNERKSSALILGALALLIGSAVLAKDQNWNLNQDGSEKSLIEGGAESKKEVKSNPQIESQKEIKSDPQAENLKKDFTHAKEVLEQQESSARAIMSSLFAINKKLKKIVTEKSNLDQQRLSVEDSASDLNDQMKSQEQELQSEKQLLMKRLGAIYRFGAQGSIRVLFSSNSSADLERNLKILGLLAKRDLDLAKNYHDSVLEIAHKKANLQKKIAKLEKLTSGIKVQEKLLAHEDQEKCKYLNQLKKSRVMNEKKLNDLRAKSKEVAENDSSGILDLLLRPSFAEQKGQLDWPIKGTLKEKFGIYHDAQYPIVLSNKGIFVSTQKNTPVHSVFSGRVAYQGNVDGFGRTLIIDHGDHYYSVYSNIEGVDVGLGDEVEQNQIVAKSGLDPARSIEGIYFEIRHFSEPADPSLWMKGSLQ